MQQKKKRKENTEMWGPFRHSFQGRDFFLSIWCRSSSNVCKWRWDGQIVKGNTFTLNPRKEFVTVRFCVSANVIFVHIYNKWVFFPSFSSQLRKKENHTKKTKNKIKWLWYNSWFFSCFRFISSLKPNSHKFTSKWAHFNKASSQMAAQHNQINEDKLQLQYAQNL